MLYSVFLIVGMATESYSIYFGMDFYFIKLYEILTFTEIKFNLHHNLDYK